VEPDDGAAQISAGEFGVAFKGFLEQAVAQAPVEPPFFFPVREHPNVQRSLDGYLEGEGRSAELIGVASA
jgi:hypothetical protein